LSKKKWEQILEYERRGLNHEFDQEAAIEAIMLAPADLQ
jgi:hypothetical protein